VRLFFGCGGEGVLSRSVTMRAVPSSLVDNRTNEWARFNGRVDDGVLIGLGDSVGLVGAFGKVITSGA
jgi:hypothetical protein